jgi:hypothetical protein
MTRWPSKRAEKSRRGAASWPFTNVNEPAAAALAALGSLWANVKACPSRFGAGASVGAVRRPQPGFQVRLDGPGPR